MRFVLMLLALMLPSLAQAQSPAKLCYPSTEGASNCITVSPQTPLPVVQTGAAFTNITTNTDTSVLARAGGLVGFSVNTAGTGSTVKFFDDADGTCSSNLIGTFTTTAQAFVQVPAAVANGICAQTAGGVAADITVFAK